MADIGHSVPCWCSYCGENTLKMEDQYYDYMQQLNKDYDEMYQRLNTNPYPFSPGVVPELPTVSSAIQFQQQNNPTETVSETPDTPPLAPLVQSPPEPSQPIDGTPWWQSIAPATPPLQSHPFDRRVNLDIVPWDLTPLQSRCPGRYARYTVTVQPKGLALLELQTWSGIYRKYRFWLRNLSATYTEINAENMPYTILEMRRGTPIKILFETLEEAEECHEYIFSVTER